MKPSPSSHCHAGRVVTARCVSNPCKRGGLSTIVLASTTSVENSGLLAHILPQFTKETGIEVHVIAQGTGQALATAAHGDADLVLVHDPEAEAKFMAAGDGGLSREEIAWNDFIFVGPKPDPAHLANTRDAVAAPKMIATKSSVCLTRR